MSPKCAIPMTPATASEMPLTLQANSAAIAFLFTFFTHIACGLCAEKIMALTADSTKTASKQEWENHLPQILAVQTVFTFVVLTVVALRFYVRVKLIKSTGVDDWTMLFAALCALFGWVLWVFRGVYGLGRSDAWFAEGNGDRAKVAQGSFWQAIIESALGMAMLKISIALNLLRLSPARWYVWCLWTSIVVVIAYCFMGAMTFFLYCVPMSAYWTHAPGSRCYSTNLFITFGLVNTGFNILTDVLFATVPIPVIWSLKMAPKMRLYLIGILSLGYLAVIFGILKAIYQVKFTGSKDEYLDDWILFWATIQFNVGIIAACIPSLKPLVSKALKFPEYSNTNRTRGLYGSRSRPRRTPTAPGGSMPTIMIRGNNPIWSIHKGDQYSLQALGSRDSGSRSDGELAGEKSATTRYTEKWYSTDCLHPGSQDYEEKDGIIKTTEIIVT
ncbi:hypothetical protein N7475_003056 [Penicillium sp. IBT 31633x]|nr:hypothetical protein N7475_003056 [Penicillium sp. IBT 31633x]